MNMEPHPDSRLIDAFGGTLKTAQFFEITTGAVSQWRKAGMPKYRKTALRFARPKIFRAWERGESRNAMSSDGSIESYRQPTSKEQTHA